MNHKAVEFRKHHMNSMNVFVHLITTPMGILGWIMALNKSIGLSGVMCTIYSTTLFPFLSVNMWAKTVTVLIFLQYLAGIIQFSFTSSLTMVMVAYILQDMIHFACGETTLQSTYGNDWMNKLAEHTFFLLPLCLDVIHHTDGSILWLLVPYNHVFFAKLNNEKETSDRASIRDWVISQSPSSDHTTHWWFESLPEACKTSFHNLMHSTTMYDMFYSHFKKSLYTVEAVPDMNEIYVSSDKHDMNSDTVFYMNHTDGPFRVYPFCGLYRCMLSVNENEMIRTRFPFGSKEFTLSDGDVVGFDYNREIHDIYNNPDTQNKSHRITLKLHYVVYPTAFKTYGKFLATISTWYNTMARSAFLNTISPMGFWKFMNVAILTITKLCFQTEAFAGWTNMTYVACVALVCDYRIFVIFTSFLHYFIYIGVYNKRIGVSFGQFKRNVIFFKGVALSNLVYLYWKHGGGFSQINYVSFILLLGGYSLSAAATYALGINATYFGVELGECPPKFITTFPYGTVPHPMIMGSIIGLLGFHALSGLRSEMPWLVPIHISLYLIHMIQESTA